MTRTLSRLWGNPVSDSRRAWVDEELRAIDGVLVSYEQVGGAEVRHTLYARHLCRVLAARG